ncbi:hypothetical protein [Candidatus Ichthyocystis sparus]|uniref:hypothetical protein n=1 Tax=Candidatus Ichthyocystis sparus TaxID=1561004 RepID=UPI000B823BF8|nr:hypothetical protein [Candidatus Ichthyocystis sparus]
MNCNVLLPKQDDFSLCGQSDQVLNVGSNFAETDVMGTLSQIVDGAGGVDAITSTVVDGNETDDHSLTDNFWQDICSFYDCCSEFKTISEIYADDFFQLHAIKNGYRFTESFLFLIGKNEKKLISEVDYILEGSFPFFYELKKDQKNISNSMKKIFLDFSKSIYCKYVCHLKPKFTDILRYSIVPVIASIIIDSKVICDKGEREMTYREMEDFFLHYVTTAVRMVVSRIINYWDCFFDKSMSISSLLPYIDYTNNFSIPIYSNSFTNIFCSSAFTYKFGLHISFMASVKVDVMVDAFVRKCSAELKRVIHSKCVDICNNSVNAIDDIKKIRYELQSLIRKEFDKNINDEIYMDNFSSFLNGLSVFDKDKYVTKDVKKNKSVLFSGIVNVMFESLLNTAVKDSKIIIKYFHGIIRRSKSAISDAKFQSGNYLIDIEDKLGVRLHPDDSYNVLSIRRKFISKYNKVIRDNFSKMLKEKYEFKDDSVISMVSWGEISDKLYPIAKELVSHLVKEESDELYRLFSSARIVEDNCLFDGSNVGTREATFEEKNILFKITMGDLDLQNRNSFKIIWENLIKTTNIEISEDVCFVREKAMSLEVENRDIDESSPSISLPTKDEYLLFSNLSLRRESFTTSSLSSDNSNYDSFRINKDRIIDKWGLDIHPKEVESILFIMKNVSIKIRSIISRIFFFMIESKTVLPVILFGDNDYSWHVVPSGLYIIAKESVEKTIKYEHLELSKALSKLQIIDVVTDKALLSDSHYCVREINDDEKEIVMDRVNLFIHEDLESAISTLWLEVSNAAKENYMINEYSEKFESIDEFYLCNDCIIVLRCEDSSAILNVRKRFASEICATIYSKFYGMLDCSYRFDSDVVITKSSWKRISKKLSPIAKNEIGPILDNERSELHKILRVARVVVDSKSSRDLTDEEKSNVLESIMKLVRKESQSLFKGIWEDVIILFVDGGCGNKNHCFAVDLFYEDYDTIFSIRRKFSSEIRASVHNKFSEMLRNNYKFDDGSVICISSWKCVSKKLLPIAKKEIRPILEKERIEINKILLKSRIVISDSDSFSSKDTRILTCEERLSALEDIMKFVYKQAIDMIGRVWRSVIGPPMGNILGEVGSGSVSVLMKSSSVDSSSIKMGVCESIEDDNNTYSDVKLRFIDNLAISSARRVFSSEMSICIRNKFYLMLKGRYRFDSNTVIRMVSWSNISKELLPIAESEIKPIMDRERIEINDILLESRVLMSSHDIFSRSDLSFGMTRALTQKERFITLEKIMKSVHKQSLCMFSRVWGGVIRLIHKRYSKGCLNYDASDGISKITESGTVSSILCDEEEDIIEEDLPLEDIIEESVSGSSLAVPTWGIKIRYHDEILIINERRNFSYAMKIYIHDKFCEMLKNEYKFDDCTVISKLSWRKLSKKLIPIAQKEAEPIIEDERIALHGILLKSRVVIPKIYDGSYYHTRELTDNEVSTTLDRIMGSVRKQAIDIFGSVWESILNSSDRKYSEESVRSIFTSDDFYISKVIRFVDLRDEDKTELDNIRIEFFGVLGPIVGEIMESLLVDADASLPQFRSILHNVNLTVYRKSHVLFEEEGFFSRVGAALSTAKVVGSSGNDRSLTDNERKFLFRLFMYNLDKDRYYLVKKRIEEFRRSNLVVGVVPIGVDASSILT